MDFNKLIDRYHTDCLKYDAAARRGRPADVLPLWVADMDLPVSPAIIEALQKRLTHPIFGYSEADPVRFARVLSDWFSTRHSWQIQPEWLIQTPGVVFALAMAVKAYTLPGDAVFLQQPVYYPFSEVITDNGRRIVSSDLVLQNGHYEIDFADFEQKIIDNQIKLFLLCNPHNPVGRVWTKAELRQLGDICLKHGVIVVADEIHQDFIWEGHAHTVFASLGDSYANQSIVCTSPSKTFNIAGLQLSNIFIPNEKLRRRFKKETDAAGYSQLNTLGLIAAEAAYRDGSPWLEELKPYLRANIDYLKEQLQQHVPQIKWIEPEGTYLIWLDFRALQLSEEDRECLLLQKARLWLDSGAIFGAAGDGFERINIACPRATITEFISRLSSALNTR